MSPITYGPNIGNYGSSLDFFSTAWTLKLLFFVLIFGYVFYVILLAFRVRILAETVHTPNNGLLRTIAFLHLIVAVVGSLLALVLILLA